MSDIVVVKVGPKGRIVLPAAVRQRYGFAEGDELVMVAEPHGVRLIDRGHPSTNSTACSVVAPTSSTNRSPSVVPMRTPTDRFDPDV